MAPKTSTRRRRVVEEEVEDEEMLLQDILALKEPTRTHTLQDWIALSTKDLIDGGSVKIGTASGSAMQVPLEGKQFNIPPAGKYVARELALILLLGYGIAGKYRGRDQATGMTLGDKLAFNREQREFYADYVPKFYDDYLIQIPRESDIAEETETNE